MKLKWKKLIMMFALILTVFSIGTSVIADDGHDDDDDDERHEYYQETDDDEENWQAPPNEIPTQQQTEYWYIWSREARNNPNNPLPSTDPAEFPVVFEENKTNVYLIPQDGQLLVSANEMAKILGAHVSFYQQSKIAILQKDDLELAVKAGSNAAFENKLKTPMPTQATSYEQSVFLPISVAANALGYRVSWDQAKQEIVIKSI
ncbi:copper amine oxidase N-terminal domain-containing protein [Neobacillus drentensis]|uniref:copper amine oxidase N-terminal domain-containing protein n=1 Tax=Neobacillus drentensis TaxID=220684 RepID=UPI002FFE1CCB